MPDKPNFVLIPDDPAPPSPAPGSGVLGKVEERSRDGAQRRRYRPCDVAFSDP
jgi:hypothetical protein